MLKVIGSIFKYHVEGEMKHIYVSTMLKVRGSIFKYNCDGERKHTVFNTLYKYVHYFYASTCFPGAFPHVYDKTKPEIDSVAVGKAYMDPLS